MQTETIPPTEKELDKGFTLIELLVVVVIIGILAAVAIPVFLNQREKGFEAGIKSDLKNAATVQETYFVDNRTYATDEQMAAEGFEASDSNTIAVASASSTAYCINGSSDGTDTTYHYNSETGGLEDGSCAAPA